MTRILLIDDDRKLAEGVAEFLGARGHSVELSRDGGAALAQLRAAPFDLLLLDLTLPDGDGIELARRIRRQCATPIIMITARGDDADKILGLELGADDYLTKPFNPHELLARIRAVLRRSRIDRAVFQTGGLRVDFEGHAATVDGRDTALTRLEFSLLAALCRNVGRVLSRTQLLDHLRGEEADEVFDRAVDVHVSRLRQKIEADPRQPRYLKTIRGIGYVVTRDE